MNVAEILRKAADEHLWGETSKWPVTTSASPEHAILWVKDPEKSKALEFLVENRGVSQAPLTFEELQGSRFMYMHLLAIVWEQEQLSEGKFSQALEDAIRRYKFASETSAMRDEGYDVDLDDGAEECLRNAIREEIQNEGS